MTTNKMKEGYSELKRELAQEMKLMKEIKERIADIKLRMKLTKQALDKKKPIKETKKAYFDIDDKVYVDEIGKTKDKKYRKLPNKVVHNGKWESHLDSPRPYHIVVKIPPPPPPKVNDNNQNVAYTPNRRWF